MPSTPPWPTLMVLLATLISLHLLLTVAGLLFGRLASDFRTRGRLSLAIVLMASGAYHLHHYRGFAEKMPLEGAAGRTMAAWVAGGQLLGGALLAVPGAAWPATLVVTAVAGILLAGSLCWATFLWMSADGPTGLAAALPVLRRAAVCAIVAAWAGWFGLRRPDP
ncbi:MAG: hypothetical protein HYY25_14395 [Candidatus Wallbacteria bacterium]|nr:hypothetical protein [Candidatus Wallbacteria bacterium]